jgi:K+-transporting ATPase ATPase A chain
VPHRTPRALRWKARFGLAASSLFAATTTLTSTGAVNSTHDSLTAPGGGLAMFNMMLGEISPGGVGSGLYGMLIVAIVTVFLSGLMVGRTPEYLGKKIGRREITLVALYVLTMPLLVLVGTGVSVVTGAGLAGPLNTGPHGLSEILYAFTSAANNNGSAFGGIASGTPYYNTLLGLAMLVGRFVPIALVLALAGRFASQPTVPASSGTLPTHKPLFVGLVGAVAVVVVGLTFIPALSLGPVVESLS